MPHRGEGNQGVIPFMSKEGNVMDGGPSGAVYGMGFIGALIFFISRATGFWMGVLGVLKAMVWPALLVFEAFKYMAK